jgi:hypothetical protein
MSRLIVGGYFLVTWCPPSVKGVMGMSTSSSLPLRLKRGMAGKLLAIPHFQNVSTKDLIHAAQKKFAARKPRKGIVISDRATAIALLVGTAECEEDQR